jgi:toxin ParE1/3/4
LKIRFISPANVELEDAIKYYDHQLPGLGFRFFQEISSAIERIKLIPEAWTKMGEHTRRCSVKGFPYAIFYVIEKEEILIMAIAHLHRNPENYKDRIS